MAQDTTVAVVRDSQETSRLLTREQTSKAVRALLKHIAAKQQERAERADKHSLIRSQRGGSGEEVAEEDDIFIWLILSTKKHIQDSKSLKPSKIAVPHPLFAPPSVRVCLITADPQRAFKDVVADEAFPASLRVCVTRVISISKLRTKYKAYESRRQLQREHDVFLVDDRVFPMLPGVLGKAFYKTSAKRPIPISTSGSRGKKAPPNESGTSSSRAEALASVILRALSSAPLNLAPSTSTAIRVARASWAEEKVTDNVLAVVDGMTAKHVPQGWKSMRSLHIKGPKTTGLPLWLADQLWVDEADVVEDPAPKEKADDEEGKPMRRKRGRRRNATARGEDHSSTKSSIPAKRPKSIAGDDGFDDELELDVILKQHQHKFKKQKKAALAAFDADDDTAADKRKVNAKGKNRDRKAPAVRRIEKTVEQVTEPAIDQRPTPVTAVAAVAAA